MLCSDVIELIISHDLGGSAYKIYCLISTQWRIAAKKVVPNADIALCNQIQTLILLFPHAKWNWNILSKRVKWEFIRDNKFPWNYSCAAKNPNITYAHMLRFPPERRWEERNSTYVRKNINVTLEEFKKLEYISPSTNIKSAYSCRCNIAKMNYIPIDITDFTDFMSLHKLSRSKAITWEFIQANPQIKWNYTSAKNNPNVTAEIILKNNHMFAPWDAISKPDWTWNMNYPDHLKWGTFMLESSAFCARKCITREIVETNPKIAWNFRGLSMNPNFTFEFMQGRPDLPWVWSRASMNPSITFDIIINNPEIPWGRRWVGRNPNITWKIVRDNPYFGWKWKSLSKYLCRK